MTSLATPIWAPSPSFGSGRTDCGPIRYLYQVPASRSDDRRSISVSFPARYEEAKRQVIDITVAAVNRLLQLPSGWDGMHAAAISDLAALTAIEWLDRIATSESLTPHVVPLTNGGVQLEWVVGGESLEIEADPDGEVGVLGVDAAGNVLVEGELPSLDNASLVRHTQKFLNSLSGAPNASWR